MLLELLLLVLVVWTACVASSNFIILLMHDDLLVFGRRAVITIPMKEARLVRFPVPVDIWNMTLSALSWLDNSETWLLQVLLLLDLDLHERVLMVLIIVEVAWTEGHLRLPENRLLLLSARRTHFWLLYEEVSVLIFSVVIIHFLLQALDWLLMLLLLLLLLLIWPLLLSRVSHHEIARVRHAVISRLPRTHTLSWNLVEVVLCHATHFHGGHRMILFICEVLRLFRSIQIVGTTLMKTSWIVYSWCILLSVLFGG